MCRIANWISIGMERNVELQTEDGRYLRRELEGELPRLTAFRPSNLSVRYPDEPTDLALAHPGRPPCRQKFRGCPANQVSPTTGSSINRAFIERHDPIIDVVA